MHRLAYLAIFVASAAGCRHDKAAPASPANTGTGSASTTPAGPLDCGTVDTRTNPAPADAQGTYECFAEAFRAGREASVQWLAVTDEGGKIFTTYRVLPVEGGGPPLLAVTTDDRDDGFAASPGVHELTCKSLQVERTTSGGLVLRPEGCSGAL